MFPIGGNDDIRGGSDHRDRAPEQGPEGQRHEEQGRRVSAPAGHQDGHRHEQGQGAHVVHES